METNKKHQLTHMYNEDEENQKIFLTREREREREAYIERLIHAMGVCGVP